MIAMLWTEKEARTTTKKEVQRGGKGQQLQQCLGERSNNNEKGRYRGRKAIHLLQCFGKKRSKNNEKGDTEVKKGQQL